MLNPQQLGILAQLVYDALVKFPTDPEPVEPHEYEEGEIQPWEAYLMAEVARIPEMPDYEELEHEVDILTDYFDFNIRFEEGRKFAGLD